MFTKPAVFRLTIYAALAMLTSTLAWTLVDAGLELGFGL